MENLFRPEKVRNALVKETSWCNDALALNLFTPTPPEVSLFPCYQVDLSPFLIAIPYPPYPARGILFTMLQPIELSEA